MAKKEEQKMSFITNLAGSQKAVARDAGHGSRAFVPVQIDEGNSVEMVQVDGGLITGLPKGEPICDSLLYTVNSNCPGLNITWIIELKGTKNDGEARHAIDQITKSIQYMQDQIQYPQAKKYIANRDFVFAAVAGAPDKTLPVLNNDQLKTLCKKLKAVSSRRKDVKDMFMLFCYIRPNGRCRKAEVRGKRPPYDIMCYHNQEGYIPYPSMLMKLLE